MKTKGNIQNKVNASEGILQNTSDILKDNSLSVLMDYVKNQSEQLNIDLVAILAPALSSLGVAIGNNRKLHIDGGHYESPSIWTIIIAPPGSRKTATLKAGTAGLQQIQDKWTKQNLIDRCVLLQDATIPAINKTLYNNQRGLLWRVDEFDQLVSSMRGLGQILSYWSGDEVRIDRKKENFVIPSGYVFGIASTTQPEVILGQLAKRNGTKNGFADRFLYCFSKPLKNTVKKGRTPSPKNDPYYNAFIDLFNKLVSLEDKKILELDDDALERYNQYQADNQNLAIDKNDSYYGKLDVHVSRIALVLELCKDIEATHVSLDTLELSIKIVSWFNNCRLELFKEISKSKNTKLEDTLLAYLKKHPGKTANEIRQGAFCSKGRPERNALHSALKSLESMRLLYDEEKGRKKLYYCNIEEVENEGI